MGCVCAWRVGGVSRKEVGGVTMKGGGRNL